MQLKINKIFSFLIILINDYLVIFEKQSELSKLNSNKQ